MSTRQKIALIGCGYWGPNIAKSMEETSKGCIKWFCDLEEERLKIMKEKYPLANFTQNIDEVLKDKDVGAVAISTPVSTHFNLGKKCLEAHCHVLLEKPLTLTSKESLSLIKISQKVNKILMVGHVFEYNTTIEALKKIISSGELGQIYYMNFVRTNLGPVRTDVNALWDLATHDISIMCYLLNEEPIDVTARGQDYLNKGIEDILFATFTFKNKTIAHVHASWLNPQKIRRITVVGSKKMAIWDDLDMRKPICLYDKRVEWASHIDNSDSYLSYKTLVVDGGMDIPHVPLNQPLQTECEHFLECIEKNLTPNSDGYSGLRVVKILEAMQESMRNKSCLIPIKVPSPSEI